MDRMNDENNVNSKIDDKLESIQGNIVDLKVNVEKINQQISEIYRVLEKLTSVEEHMNNLVVEVNVVKTRLDNHIQDEGKAQNRKMWMLTGVFTAILIGVNLLFDIIHFVH
jgi:regulator of replication initiation timing